MTGIMGQGKSTRRVLTFQPKRSDLYLAFPQGKPLHQMMRLWQAAN